jgi:IMP dehydrogenase
LVILPQDMSLETLEKIIKAIKNADVQYDSPITVTKNNTIRDAM